MHDNSEKRTPLKDRPLRQAGQSLREERAALMDGRVTNWLLAPAFAIVLAGLEWWRYLTQQPPAPWTLTLLAVFTVTVAAFPLARTHRRLRRLRLAIDGETVVGQFLERLHANGYQTFHDVLGEHFNIDHILIGPGGVYTVETKTRSKRSGNPKITFDGEALAVDGYPEPGIVTQARAQAHWLQHLLHESTGRRISVHPIVVFPGWFVEQTPASLRSIWILEPKAIPAFLESAPEVLSVDESKMACLHLSRWIRNGETLRGR